MDVLDGDAVGIPDVSKPLIYKYLAMYLEHEKIENDFNKQALEIILTVKDSVVNQVSCFNYIVSFFTATNNVDIEQFKEYLHKLKKQYNNIHSVGWIPYNENQRGFFLNFEGDEITAPIPIIGVEP